MRRISIDEARPGMVVGRALLTESGELLLGAGVKLTELYVKSLWQRGYSSLVIDDEESAGIAVPDVLSTQIRAVTTAKLRQTFEVFGSVTADQQGQSPEAVAQHLQSGAFTAQASEVDPFRAILGEAQAIIDELLTVEVLDGLNSLKLHDEYALQHCIDVTVASLLIGRRLRLDQNELRVLALGGLLHDIGKVFIEQSIIQKPGALTDDEWAKVRTHPYLGYLTLRVSGSEHDVLAHHVAYQHHERQDGTGYPRGLTGANRIRRTERVGLRPGRILLIAEIVAVANAYESLSSPRRYRAARPHEQMGDVLQELAGPALNRQIVEAFLEVLPSFPTGTAIEVMSGRYQGYRGLVARVDRAHMQRPWIRLTRNPSGRPVELADLDLLEEDDIQIRSLPLTWQGHPDEETPLNGVAARAAG